MPDTKLFSIVEDQCEIAPNNLAASIVLETSLDGGSAIEVLKSADARNAALAFASSKGINRPGINEAPDVFPVTHDGTSLDAAQAKAAEEGKSPQHPDLQATGYRCRIRVVGNPV